MKTALKGQAEMPDALPRNNGKQAIFAGLFGALLGLTLLKFGNPIIMEKMVTEPSGFWEWLLTAWPVVVGYWLLGIVAVAGISVARWRTLLPGWLICLPLIWLGWEAMAATQTEVARLSGPTLFHFSTCVLCFYLGLFSLSGVPSLRPFWAGLIVGFGIVLLVGFQQHFGGLKESREYWLQYVYPTPEIKKMPPEDLSALLKKMASTRIFATLFYPNTLAGVILLLLPVTLAVLWSLRERFTAGARGLLMTLAAAAALACLYWSGSKGGWLLMLATGFVGAMFLPFKRQTKLILFGAVLVLGMAGFFVKYSGFFKRGATSVVARFDYWQAAVQTVKEKPVFGAGPGTFGKSYEKRKRPESEMAQLAHNDYLQQASDSGVPGFLAYTVFVITTLVYTWRKAGLKQDWIRLAVWLGLLGWAMQSLVEFGLYIPAVGWVAFAFMGWLLSKSRNEFDTLKPTG